MPNVDIIMAPYESDAQLAFLTKEHFADAVITEDSDLIAFGCEKVTNKLPISNRNRLFLNGTLIKVIAQFMRNIYCQPVLLVSCEKTSTSQNFDEFVSCLVAIICR